jgi:hypothetical protein
MTIEPYFSVLTVSYLPKRASFGKFIIPPRYSKNSVLNFDKKWVGLDFGQLFHEYIRSPRFSAWDRCYDFKNIFAEKIAEKNGVLYTNYC